MRDALTSAFRDLSGGLAVQLDESYRALKRELETIGEPPSAARLEVLRTAQASLVDVFNRVRGLLENL
jgi:uncharacterized caspase-like protein